MSNTLPSITVVELSGCSLIGISVHTDMQKATTDCPAVWTQFMSRIHEVAEPDTTQANFLSYGVSQVTDIESGKFKYWATIPMSKGKEIPLGMETTPLEAGLYAKYSDVPLAEINNAFSFFYEQWAPAQTDYALDMSKSCLELYDGRFVTAGTVDLYIAVVAK